jgi:hypothetical protein
MGYDLHITRKAHWIDQDGPTISPEEWLSLLEADPELSRATDAGDDTFAGAWKGDTTFWFTDGEVRCKNPDPPTVRKMVAIARRFGATLQGDDGEQYREDGSSFHPQCSTPPPARSAGILTRIASWFGHRRTARDARDTASGLRTGQRVVNPWGELGTILSVDRNANAGLGSVRVRLDDGREQNLAYAASGLEPVTDPAADAV